MNCRDCEAMLAAYSAGDLNADEATACRAHLDACPACAAELKSYALLVSAISEEPGLEVAPSESVTLAAALARVRIPAQAARRPAAQPAKGLAGLLAASALAFVLVAAVLVLQAFRFISIGTVISEANAGTLIAAWLLVVVVTSFIPIAVTAQRRPLNGMTFRR